jgi:hypothetical protein
MSKPLFLILDFQQIMNIIEIIVLKDFEVENGILGLERDVYLSIVKFIFVNIKKSITKYFLFNFYSFFDSTLELVKNHTHE